MPRLAEPPPGLGVSWPPALDPIFHQLPWRLFGAGGPGWNATPSPSFISLGRVVAGRWRT
eukprot:7415838-Lingulodinium_polyedra.AAC.1